MINFKTRAKVKSKQELLRTFMDTKNTKLKAHTRRNENTSHINYKVYYLLCHSHTFINAYAKVSKNLGALTKGYNDKEAMQNFGKIQAERIASKFLEGSYRFSPVRRVWIPKPGKKKKRPVDTPTQEDRIVQEAIRGILESIYEPEFVEFEKNNDYTATNYGFRPQKSTWDAVDLITQRSRRSNLVIEGDIKSAYNTINQKKLIHILSKRIKDKKFLDIIKGMLRSGIMEKNKFEHSLTGTPQGGIVSPLLFNIYMLEFDKFVYEHIIAPIQKENHEKKPQKNKEWRRLAYNANLALIALREEETGKGGKRQLLKREFKKNQSDSFKTPSQEVKSLPKSILYTRYADDWVIVMTGRARDVIEVKEKLSNFIKEELHMELDQDKTKISKLTDGFCFLGYSIRMYDNKTCKRMTILRRKPGGGYNRFLKKTTSRVVNCIPDMTRLRNKLIRERFCLKDYWPTANKYLSQVDEYEIVLKYEQIMSGIYNYYRLCDNLYLLDHVHYLLTYSCAKTIALRRKSTMPQVFSRFGKSLEVKREKKHQGNTFTSTIKITSMKELKARLNMRRSHRDPDPFNVVKNWRTAIKLYQDCCMCGSDDRIAMHHLNSLGNLKLNEKDKHHRIRSQIDRKQIPVCHSCHMDITQGR